MKKDSLLSKLFHRYFIIALNGMALGLFCTLIIGLIIKQIAINLSGGISTFFIVIATIAMALTGPVIGIGVAHALKAPKLVILASGVVGFLGAFGSNLGTNHLIEQGKLIVSGSGDPLGAFIAVVIAAECGRLVSGKTKIDIIVTPFVTIVIGATVAYFTGPYLIKGMKILGTFIREATELQPFLDATDRLIVLMEQLKEDGIKLKHLDLGGGLGVTYTDETPPHPSDYANALLEKLKNYPELEIILEPGRAISANAGILVAKVQYLKSNESRNFAITDTGMNDMIRPALYEAYMNIVEIDRTLAREKAIYDVVGPVCETSDFLGKQRELSIAEGDYIAQCSAGAYGASMSSNYNSRPRTAEVLVDGDKSYLIRRRENLQELCETLFL